MAGLARCQACDDPAVVACSAADALAVDGVSLTVAQRLPDAFTVDVEFKKPILLPSTVVFGSRTDGGVITLGVTSARKPSTHLVGRISPA